MKPSYEFDIDWTSVIYHKKRSLQKLRVDERSELKRVIVIIVND